jgi:tight adherence protein B
VRVFLAAALAALALPAAALAGLEVKGVDTKDYPKVRLTVVADRVSPEPPTLSENGEPVSGVVAENLGRSKSIVLAVDRSRSMEGEALDDAAAAAADFVGSKSGSDRIALVAFGSRAVALTDFSSATIDADTALRTLGVDDRKGTALYDALVLSARALAAEPLPGRVIIVLTDGADASSEASAAEAISAARQAGAVVYPIAIESNDFSPEPLQRLARETGGTYFGAASSASLGEVYASIAAELQRTWRVEYFTAARPGEERTLEASLAGETAKASLEIPGDEKSFSPQPSRLLPSIVYESAWAALLLGLIVGFCILLAAVLAFASPKGAWVRRRVNPHVAAHARAVAPSDERERLAAAAGLFKATENTFGHARYWKKLQWTLERADLPLRTVEFVYVMLGCGFVAGMIGAVAALPSFAIVGCLLGGALAPYGFVAFKARKRLKAFESQLPDLLVTMAAALKAGHSFRMAMQNVVDEADEPAAKEFKRVLTETRLGRPMDQALSDMAERIGSKNLDFVINAVAIQRQVGGSLAGLFDMVADTVRQRQQFARKIKGLTAMGRMSAYTLVGLPFFIAFAISVLNRQYMEPLFHTSTGHKLIVIGLFMMTIGSLMLRKIVSFKG